MDIDAVIAEHTAQAEAQAQPAEAKIEATQTDAKEAPQEEAQVETDETQEPTEETEAKTEELFPKKAVNALQRKEKKIGKLSARLEYEQQARQQLEAELAKFKGNQQQEKPKAPQENNNVANLNNPDGSPNEEAYEKAGLNYGDYLKASARYEARQELAENTKKAQETQVNQELAKWADERSAHVDKRVTELATSIPDFEQTLDEIEDSLPPLTPELAKLALEAEDINLAVYTLHKEGKLMDVMKLPPSRLAAEIARAEIRGQQYLKPQNPISNAPKPLTPSKGSGAGSKALDRMSYAELKESLKIA